MENGRKIQPVGRSAKGRSGKAEAESRRTRIDKVMSVLADGEWHSFFDLRDVVEANIRPEVALRTCKAWRCMTGVLDVDIAKGVTCATQSIVSQLKMAGLVEKRGLGSKAELRKVSRGSPEAVG